MFCMVWNITMVNKWSFLIWVPLSRSWLVSGKHPHLLLFSRQRMSSPSCFWQAFNCPITRKLTIRTSANTQNEQSSNCDTHTRAAHLFCLLTGTLCWFVCDKSRRASFSCRSHQTNTHIDDVLPCSNTSLKLGMWAFNVIYMWVSRHIYRVMNSSSH